MSPLIDSFFFWVKKRIWFYTWPIAISLFLLFFGQKNILIISLKRFYRQKETIDMMDWVFFYLFFYFEKHDGLSHTHNSCYIVMKGTIIYAFPGWMNRTNSYSSSSTTTCRHQDVRNSKLWQSHCGLITRFWKRVIKYK